MSDLHDVVIVGGGPAGLAAAGALARRGRSVALLERGELSAPRVGETLGPEVGPLLAALGAWEAVAPALDVQARFTETRSAWGSASVEVAPSIRNPLGDGWHVDRARLDGALAAWAADSGALVRFGAGSCAVERVDGGFAVQPRGGARVGGRRLVDASGRGAPVATALGLGRWAAWDRQVALLGRLAPTPGGDTAPSLLLEPVDIGFWYASPQPGGELVAVLVTDADLLVRLGKSREERFEAALARSTHVAGRAAGRALLETPRAFRSESGRLLAGPGEGWCAVGDAALATDPLGGNGVARALRAALDLAEAGEAAFASEDRRAAERRFGEYLDVRAGYYALEDRWAAEPYWARRRPAAPDGAPLHWRRVPVALPPDAVLTWVTEPGPAAEAWVPPAGLAALRDVLSTPCSAHALLERLRGVTPIGPQRLVVGLQWLLAAGVLAQV